MAHIVGLKAFGSMMWNYRSRNKAAHLRPGSEERRKKVGATTSLKDMSLMTSIVFFKVSLPRKGGV